MLDPGLKKTKGLQLQTLNRLDIQPIHCCRNHYHTRAELPNPYSCRRVVFSFQMAFEIPMTLNTLFSSFAHLNSSQRILSVPFFPISWSTSSRINIVAAFLASLGERFK